MTGKSLPAAAQPQVLTWVLRLQGLERAKETPGRVVRPVSVEPPGTVTVKRRMVAESTVKEVVPEGPVMPVASVDPVRRRKVSYVRAWGPEDEGARA
jgi:hypothetical protein